MAFRQNYPFDFSLLNDSDKNENVFYLEDKVKTVTLKIINPSLESSAAIIGVTSVDDAGPANYHFALSFRPDTINPTQLSQEVPGWKISAVSKPDITGCVTLYFVHTGDTGLFLSAARPILVPFNIDINGGTGSRTTNVQMTSNNIANTGIATRQINWSLINHVGAAKMPVQINFKDSDTILNDINVKNELNLRITNTLKDNTVGTKYIQFSNDPLKPSRISFFFDQNETPSASSIGNKSGVKGIQIDKYEVDGTSTVFVGSTTRGTSYFDKTVPNGQDPLNVWTFSPGTRSVRLAPVITNDANDNFTRNDPYQLSLYSSQAGIITQILAEGTEVVSTGDGTGIFTINGVQAKATFHGRFHFPKAPDPVFPLNSAVLAGAKIGYIERWDQQADQPVTATFMDFKISNIITDFPSGRTKLHIRFENVPGYWDQTFEIPIDKQPLIMRGANVGVGTADPKQKLDVAGNIKVGNHTDAGSKFIGTTINNSFTSNLATGIEIESTSLGGSFSQQLHLITHHFGVSCGRRLTIDPDGNVGIGTPTPGAKLDVKGNAVVAGTAALNGNVSIGTATQNARLDVKGNAAVAGLQILSGNVGNSTSIDLGRAGVEGAIGIAAGPGQYDPSAKAGDIVIRSCAGALRFNTNCGASNGALHITTDGNIGIGTPSPATAKLVISGTSGQDGLDLSTSNLNANVRVIRNSLSNIDKDLWLGWQSGANSSLHLFSNNFETVTIKNQKIGIGTTDPKQAIDVKGNIKLGNHDEGMNGDRRFVGVTISNEFGNAAGTGTGMEIENVTVIGETGFSQRIHFHTHHFHKSSQRRVTIDHDGKVGIGIAPEYPLHVMGNITSPSGNVDVREDGKRVGNTGSGFSTKPISIFSENGMLASVGYYLTSDKRIKKSFLVTDSEQDLLLLNQLNVTSFQYKNSALLGNDFAMGFIAQEVENIFPQAINMNSDFIPDIYSAADKSSITGKALTISLKETHHLITGDSLKIYTADNEAREVTINVIDQNSFTVNDWEDSAEKLFVYGKKVNDVRSVDYQQVFSLGISAIQELSKQLDRANEKLQSQESRLMKLEGLLNEGSLNLQN